MTTICRDLHKNGIISFFLAEDKTHVLLQNPHTPDKPCILTGKGLQQLINELTVLRENMNDAPIITPFTLPSS